MRPDRGLTWPSDSIAWMAEVPESAEIVIVGGGARGASVAYHLAKKGVKDVVLLERESLASGSTSKSAGGIRAQFADELNVRMALRSMAEFQALDRVSGIEYKRHGYLFLLTNEVDVESFQKALGLQHNLGVPSRLISPDDVKAMIPALETSDLLAAAYCPIDGHASPESVVQAYAGAAAAQGVNIVQGTSLDRIAVLGDKIVTIETSAGRIRTGTVICTAGVWSRDVGNLAGLDIPVRGEARWMHFTPEDGGLPEELPLTVDFATGFYFHREGKGLVFGGREPTIEGRGEPRHAPAGARRAADPVVVVGLLRDEPRPQRHRRRGHPAAALPLRDRVLRPRLPAGAGGRGALAELVVGAEPSLDLSPLSLDRFARASGERHERFVVVGQGEAVRPRPARGVDAEHRAARERRPAGAGRADRARAGGGAHRLGEQVAELPLEACVHTRFPRTRRRPSSR